MIRTFSELQKQQGIWADHNFPISSFGDHATGAFHGLVEEIGELSGAWRAYCLSDERMDDDAKAEAQGGMKDAVGDIAIFHADYCNRRAISIDDILSELGFTATTIHEFQTQVIMNRENRFPVSSLFTWVGQLAHARLKSRQGIRAASEKHLQAERGALGEILCCLALVNDGRKPINLAAAIADTWAEVSKRDWVANPATGRPAPVAGPAHDAPAPTTPDEPDVYPARTTLAYETN